MDFPDEMTIGEARDIMRELVWTGHKCPVCTQHAQVYRWSLYSTAVRALMLYYRLGGTVRFTHSNELKLRGHKGQGDGARLRHWGLALEDSDRRGDGGKSGFWKVTEAGREFLLGRRTIPKYVWVYCGRVLKTEGKQVSVHDALGKKFDYDELMNG